MKASKVGESIKGLQSKPLFAKGGDSSAKGDSSSKGSSFLWKLGGAVKGLASYHKGGRVRKTGPANLKKGEVVLTKRQAKQRRKSGGKYA